MVCTMIMPVIHSHQSISMLLLQYVSASSLNQERIDVMGRNCNIQFTTVIGNELIVNPKPIIAITPSERTTMTISGARCNCGVVILEGGKTFEEVKELYMMYG